MTHLLGLTLLLFLAITKLTSPTQSFKELGLDDYESVPDKEFDGFIYHNRLQVKDLTQFKSFDLLCRGNYARFTRCSGDFHDIKVLYSQDKEVKASLTYIHTYPLIEMNKSYRI